MKFSGKFVFFLTASMLGVSLCIAVIRKPNTPVLTQYEPEPNRVIKSIAVCENSRVVRHSSAAVSCQPYGTRVPGELEPAQ